LLSNFAFKFNLRRYITAYAHAVKSVLVVTTTTTATDGSAAPKWSWEPQVSAAPKWLLGHAIAGRASGDRLSGLIKGR
jgi:hypothetical protein